MARRSSRKRHEWCLLSSDIVGAIICGHIAMLAGWSKIAGLHNLYRRPQCGTFVTGELTRAVFAGEPALFLLATPHSDALLFASFVPGCGQAMMPSSWRVR